MSRESKIGLIVASSFLLVVGGVLAYKLYFDKPLELAAVNGHDTEPPAGSVGSSGKPYKPPVVQKPDVDETASGDPIEPVVPPDGNRKLSNGVRQVSHEDGDPKNPDEADREVFDAFASAAADTLYVAGLASVETLRGLKGLITAGTKPAPALASHARTQGPPSLAAPPPIESPAPPALDRGDGVKLQREPVHSRAEEVKPRSEDVKAPAGSEVEEPMPPPSLQNRPRLGDRVRERDRVQPEPPPVVPFQPPAIEEPAKPQADRQAPQADRAPPLSERRPSGARLPMTFDQAYDPPGLGKPRTDARDDGVAAKPQVNAPPAGPPRVENAPRDSGQAEQHPPGIPVTLQPLPPEALVPAKPQAVLPQTGAIQPQGAPRPTGDGPQEVRPRMVSPEPGASLAPRVDAVLPRVESFDVETYFARQGETYASISLAKYQSEQYQHALAAFNRERDPGLEVVRPGRPVRIPPRDYLERQYARMIAGGVSAPGSGSAASNIAPPHEARGPRPAGAGQTARPDAFSATNQVAAAPAARPAETAPREPARSDIIPAANEKQYRVRQEDVNRPAPLWDIARRTLGSGERWAEIARLNKDRLRDVNQLQAGLVLRLPADAKVDAGAPP